MKSAPPAPPLVRRSRRIVWALLAACIASGVAGCRISERRERQLGAETAREINAQVPLVHDPVVVGYVSRLGHAIASHTSRASLDWQFFVVNSPQVNAFAVPGGFVYVDRGLIEQARTMDELAGVLGHEIGHVVLRHSVKEMENESKANAWLAVLCSLSRMCGHHATRATIRVAGTAWLARHSRRDEAQADSEAVVNVVRAGISPEGVPDMLELLLRMHEARPSQVGRWFASHPLEADRVRATRQLIQTLGDERAPRLVQDDADFHRVQARLAALPPAPAASPLPPDVGDSGGDDPDVPTP